MGERKVSFLPSLIKGLRQSARPLDDGGASHPFDERNIFPGFPPKVKDLFDKGFYSESTFEACKFLETEVRRHSGSRKMGYSLMMSAFDHTQEDFIKLNSLITDSEISEQEGFRFIFAGVIKGIRNPRGHNCNVTDDLETCISHLVTISMLLRKLTEAGYR